MTGTTPLQLHVVLCDFQRAQASVVICVCVTEDEAEAIAERLRKTAPAQSPFIDSLLGLVATFRVEAAPLTDVFEQVQAAMDSMGPPLRRAMKLAGKLTPEEEDDRT